MKRAESAVGHEVSPSCHDQDEPAAQLHILHINRLAAKSIRREAGRTTCDLNTGVPLTKPMSLPP